MKYGRYEGKKFTDAIEKLIESKMGNKQCTFWEVRSTWLIFLYSNFWIVSINVVNINFIIEILLQDINYR